MTTIVTRDMVTYVFARISEEYGFLKDAPSSQVNVVCALLAVRLNEALAAHDTVDSFIADQKTVRTYSKALIDKMRAEVARQYELEDGVTRLSSTHAATFWPTVEARLHNYMTSGITYEELMAETS